MTGSKVEPAPDTVKVDKGDEGRASPSPATPTARSTCTATTSSKAREGRRAGRPSTFVADQPGVFEVEAHDPDRLAAHSSRCS